jgi:hypothetical protein
MLVEVIEATKGQFTNYCCLIIDKLNGIAVAVNTSPSRPHCFGQ